MIPGISINSTVLLSVQYCISIYFRFSEKFCAPPASIFFRVSGPRPPYKARAEEVRVGGRDGWTALRRMKCAGRQQHLIYLKLIKTPVLNIQVI